MKNIYLSAVLKYIFEYLYLTWVLFFGGTDDFYSSTFERQILYFWLLYICMKVPVTCYFEAQLWSQQIHFLSFLRYDVFGTVKFKVLAIIFLIMATSDKDDYF